VMLDGDVEALEEARSILRPFPRLEKMKVFFFSPLDPKTSFSW